jgi:hypothetical protein
MCIWRCVEERSVIVVMFGLVSSALPPVTE